MGFSIEAMVAIPSCLFLLASSLAQAGPVSLNLRDTAVLAVQAALESEDTDACCRHYRFEVAGLTLPMVETHPQKLVEALALTRDLVRTLGEDAP